MEVSAYGGCGRFLFNPSCQFCSTGNRGFLCINVHKLKWTLQKYPNTEGFSLKTASVGFRKMCPQQLGLNYSLTTVVNGMWITLAF